MLIILTFTRKICKAQSTKYEYYKHIITIMYAHKLITNNVIGFIKD